jgi:hypothetical protein
LIDYIVQVKAGTSAYPGDAEPSASPPVVISGADTSASFAAYGSAAPNGPTRTSASTSRS